MEKPAGFQNLQLFRRQFGLLWLVMMILTLIRTSVSVTPTCTLPSLNATQYDTSGCQGSISDTQCQLRCAVKYAGSPTVTCATAGGIFNVTGYCTVAAWITVTSKPAPSFTPRVGAALLSVNSRLYLIGGSQGWDTSALNEIWTTFNGVDWTLLTQTTPFTKVNRFYANVLGTAIIITAGATDGGSTMLNKVQKSTDFGVTWTSTNAAFAARYSHFGAVLNGQMFVMGGATSSLATSTDNIPCLNDVWKTSDGGVSWTQMTASAGFNRRWGATVIGYNSALYVCGGSEDDFGGWDSELYKSSNGGVTWSMVTTGLSVWGWRYLSSMVVFSGRLYLLGGMGSTQYNSTFASADGLSWVAANAMPSKIGSFGCVNYNGSVWVAAGTGQSCAV